MSKKKIKERLSALEDVMDIVVATFTREGIAPAMPEEYTPVKVTVVHGPLPEIAVICGSTRQRKDFEALTAALTLDDQVVLSVGLFGHETGMDMSGQIKADLDELHLRKIDLADTVHFITKPDGSLGESTSREYDYAKEHGKDIVVHDLDAGAGAIEFGYSILLGGKADDDLGASKADPGPGPAPDYLTFLRDSDLNSSRYTDTAFADTVSLADPEPGTKATVIPDYADVRPGMDEEQARAEGVMIDRERAGSDGWQDRPSPDLAEALTSTPMSLGETLAAAQSALLRDVTRRMREAEEAAIEAYNKGKDPDDPTRTLPFRVEDAVKAALDTFLKA